MKAVTCRLYTWGGKVVEVPGTTLRNRLTSPTLVPRRMDVEEDVTGMMGLDGTYGWVIRKRYGFMSCILENVWFIVLLGVM